MDAYIAETGGLSLISNHSLIHDFMFWFVIKYLATY